MKTAPHYWKATAAVGVLLAGLGIAAKAEAATPSEVVGAQFRHAAIHRISVSADTPAQHITTACLARPRGVYSCSAAVWDQAGVALVFVFRFTTAKGVAGYSGPSGPRWRTTLPYGKRRHRHLVGVITAVMIGQPIVGPS